MSSKISNHCSNNYLLYNHPSSHPKKKCINPMKRFPFDFHESQIVKDYIMLKI